MTQLSQGSSPPARNEARASSARSRSRMARLLAPALEYGGMLLVLALLVAFFGYKTEHFLSRAQFQTIANQIPATVVVAVGMTYVLVIAGIDLSVGSILGLCGSVMGMCIVGTHLHFEAMGRTWLDASIKMTLWWALATALGVGLLCGIVNGAITIRWTIPSFIVTLGMLLVARGAAHWVTGSQTQYVGSAMGSISEPSIVLGLRKLSVLYRPFAAYSPDGGMSVEETLVEGQDLYLVLGMPFLVALGIVLLAQFALSRTTFGRYLVAIGTNEEAVRLSGISTWPIKVAVFAISGLLSGVAGAITAARMESANPTAGNGMELDAIAAAVIGGTSLMGGRGSVISTFFGVLIIAVLGAGLAAVGVKDETKRLVTGCVIVGAVILDHYRRRIGRGAAA